MVGKYRIVVVTTLCICVGMMCADKAHAASSALTGEIPVRITIPTASTSVSVIKVGVTTTGHLDTPHNFVQAGWYKLGTLPGNPGNAVIDGHVDNGGSIPGVFKHLKNVAIGDSVYITQASGKILHFIVTATNVYPYTAFPSESVFAPSKDSLLNIITCDGKWLPKQDTYSDRLVVTAALVSST